MNAGLGASNGIAGAGSVNAVRIPRKGYNDTADFGVSFDYPDHIAAAWTAQSSGSTSRNGIGSRADVAGQGQRAQTRVSPQYVHVAFGYTLPFYGPHATRWAAAPWIDLNTPYLTYGKGWHRVFQTFVFHVGMNDYDRTPPQPSYPPGVTPPPPPSVPSIPGLAGLGGGGGGGDPFGGDDY